MCISSSRLPAPRNKKLSGVNRPQTSLIRQIAGIKGRLMFEVWERFDAKKARSLMNRHRKTLRREHASLRRLLRTNENSAGVAGVTEQINALRQAWRIATKDQTQVCSALIDGFDVINLANLLDAFLAQFRLFATCQEIWQTLQPLDATTRAKSTS